MPSDDAMFSMFRFCLFLFALKLMLRIVPNGDSKTLLKLKIAEWATESKRQWYLRHPPKAKP